MSATLSCLHLPSMPRWSGTSGITEKMSWFQSELERKSFSRSMHARLRLHLGESLLCLLRRYTDERRSSTVRVKLYGNFETLYQDSPLSIDVPLGPSGELDLNMVQRKWNLQNCYVRYFIASLPCLFPYYECQAVDSCRLQIFETQTSGVLSGVVVRMLTDDQFWLRVIGMTFPLAQTGNVILTVYAEQPSPGRVAIRKLRSSTQAKALRAMDFFVSLPKRSSVRWLKGCFTTLSFFAGCFVAKFCMDQFHMRFDIDLGATCSSLWRSGWQVLRS